jgi:hypothetical protein
MIATPHLSTSAATSRGSTASGASNERATPCFGNGPVASFDPSSSTRGGRWSDEKPHVPHLEQANKAVAKSAIST